MTETRTGIAVLATFLLLGGCDAIQGIIGGTEAEAEGTSEGTQAAAAPAEAPAPAMPAEAEANVPAAQAAAAPTAAEQPAAPVAAANPSAAAAPNGWTPERIAQAQAAGMTPAQIAQAQAAGMTPEQVAQAAGGGPQAAAAPAEEPAAEEPVAEAPAEAPAAQAASARRERPQPTQVPAAPPPGADGTLTPAQLAAARAAGVTDAELLAARSDPALAAQLRRRVQQFHAQRGRGRSGEANEGGDAPAAAEPAAPQGNPAQAAAVRTAVRAAAADCYRSADASGEITVRVEVGSDGNVFRGRVTNNGTGSQDVARCVSGALVGRRVGGSGGGTYDIEYSR